MCVVHLYCSAQLSIFNKEKRNRNKIIIIITCNNFFRSNHTNGLKTGTLVVAPCAVFGIIGSALGMVGPVSIYCDRVRLFDLPIQFECA